MQSLGMSPAGMLLAVSSNLSDRVCVLCGVHTYSTHRYTRPIPLWCIIIMIANIYLELPVCQARFETLSISSVI